MTVAIASMQACRRWAGVLACTVAVTAVFAAPAPWFYWRSKVDGQRVCAQTSPGSGWEKDSPPYDGPGCAPRRKVLIVPIR
ncbi:hypothetical protein [Acidovorax sp.]|uniref:hypothetical protein n=1 Tax=Acidovorax sp. TaxID=1872122 RepID=UPI002ACDD5AA|nr:hypothetical protein [Acidovorax sp.]MDZ7865790.1 hypothetical protein [Acidovorax sp.]